MTGERKYLPAANFDIFLPAYDPIMALLGYRRALRPLVAQAELEPHQSVLDIGCGTGTLAILVKQLHPTVEVTVWIWPIGILTISSIGYGNDQCRPGRSNWPAPPPIGLPKRKITATSWEETVKIPEQRNTTTKITMTILIMAKLLFSASDSACDPASSAVTGAGAPWS